MQIVSTVLNRMEIKFQDKTVSCFGSYHLIELLKVYLDKYGENPKDWMPIEKKSLSTIEMLMNEFIDKVNLRYKLPYTHEEICHCRLVPTESVVQCIKTGCSSLRSVGLATKAGTGCGTCQTQIVDLMKYLTQSATTL